MRKTEWKTCRICGADWFESYLQLRMHMVRKHPVVHKTCPTWGETLCRKTLFGSRPVKTSNRWDAVTCPDCLANRTVKVGQRYGKVLVDKRGVSRVDSRTVVRVDTRGIHYRMRRIVCCATLDSWKAWVRTARLVS